MRPCEHCGQVYEPHPLSVNYQKHCSPRCGGRAYAARERAKVAHRTCPWCCAEFVADHGLRKYCSQPCKLAMARKKIPQRWRHLSSRYGLKPADFDRMLTEQGGACSICSVNLDGSGYERNAPNVDHDHETGQVRALLCRPCNIALGHLRDDPEIVRSALDYLVRWKGVQQGAA